MIVKICGIKTLQEAFIALDAGADMLGFNFYPPSPRYIIPENCAELVASLKSQVASRKPQATTLPTPDSRLITVGVFVNESLQRIREIMEICGLDLAQLSGDEPPEDLSALDGCAFKAIRPIDLVEANAFLRKYCSPQWVTPSYNRQPDHPFVRSKSVDPSVVVPALLVDAHVKGVYGGTGETGDWAVARHLATLAPILLAGGLNPENVASAVAAVYPWGVDVASGVESSPGVKDPSKISAFISAARSVNPAKV